jgi:hypothetical protein
MLRPETDLPSALTEQFGFSPEPTGNWLQTDNFKNASIGGIEEGEWLPAQARISPDGTRFEIGAKKVDLLGLIELRRIAPNSPHNIYGTLADSSGVVYQKVLDFWANQPEPTKVSVTEEEESVFMGMEVKPTARGLEAQIGNIDLSFDAAVHAALAGKTYTQMLEDRWWGSVMNQILESDPNREGSYSSVFEYERIEQEVAEGATCEPRPVVTAEKLKDYPLETSRTSLHNLPGRMVAPDGSIRELDDVMIMANNGEPTVWINDSDTNYDNERKTWTHNRTNVQLVIPEDVEIKTVADLAKLKKAQVEVTTDKYTEEKAYSELDVEITVEDNIVRMVAQDPENPFNLEIRTLACTDCEMPYWKFPWPDAEKSEEDWNPYSEFSMHSTRAGGVHGYQCFVENPEGKQDIYCLDCVTKLENRYLDEHPNAKRTTAMDITRANLDEMGYPEVQIWDTQVWRAGFEYPEAKGKGWELYTKVEYDREGRRIMRHTGVSFLGDDEEFKPNLLPDEYIRFRYRAD